MLGHVFGRQPGLCEDRRRRLVQGVAKGLCHPGVESLADQVVMEGEEPALGAEDAGLRGSGDVWRQECRRPVTHRGKVRHGERRPQDRRHLQGLHRLVGQEAEAPPDGTGERGGQGGAIDLGLAVLHPDRSLALEGSDELGREERVGSGTGDLGQQTRPGRRAEEALHQLGHRRFGELAERLALTGVGAKLIEQALQLGAAREGPHGGDDHRGKLRDLAAEAVECQQRGGIRPLEVFEGHDDRATGTEVLDEVDEGVDDAELTVGGTGQHGSRRCLVAGP